MRSGLVEEASALAGKIGSLLIQHSSAQLKDIDSKHAAGDMWKKVRQLQNRNASGMKKSTACDGITATVLNDYYASISTDKDYIRPDFKASAYRHTTAVSERDISFSLDRLRPTASGLDELPWWFLKLAAPILAEPLAQLF